jgi:hypothetical protein
VPVPVLQHAASRDSRMNIRYEITIDDVVAFQMHHVAHSKTIQRQKSILIGIVGFACLIAAIFIFAIEPNVLLAAITAVITSAVSFGLLAYTFNVSYRRGIERLARDLLAEGGNRGILGVHEIRIDDTGVTEWTAVSESRHTWHGIDQIVETDEYAFLYISALQAHVIPKHAVIAGDPTKFIQRARELLDSSRR